MSPEREGVVDLDDYPHPHLFIDTSEVSVAISRMEESCPSCSCEWVDWHDRYLCGYQPGRGRARHRCTMMDAWKEN